MANQLKYAKAIVSCYTTKPEKFGSESEKKFIGVLKKNEKKEKDNQHKLKRPMAIGIGLILIHVLLQGQYLK